MGPLIEKRKSSVQEDSRERIRRMSTSHYLPTTTEARMTRERINSLSAPKQSIVVNVNDGAEICNMTKPSMSRQKLRNIDRNHFVTAYNFSLDDYGLCVT